MSDFPLPSVTDDLRKLFRFGLSIPSISKRTGHPINQLQALVRRGLVEKPLRTKIRYYCNHDYFEVINTEQKAYWLGFLYADGCIVKGRGVNLLLAGYERPHLEAYRAALEAEHPIEERWDTIRDKGRPERIQHNVKVRITSPKMVADLLDKGCGVRKSLTLRFPTSTQVPDDLVRHFVRGYFDGDGSIWNVDGTAKWGVNVISTKRFAQQMMARMVVCGGFPPSDFSFQPHPNAAVNGMTYLGLYSFAAMNRFKAYIYDGATVWLVRKRETFDRLPPPHDRGEQARQIVLKTLRETQDQIDTAGLLEAVRQSIPDLSRNALHVALKRMTDDGQIRSLGRKGRNGHNLYVYDFA